MELILNVDAMAIAIGMSPSTIKKYYLAFEESGYQFKRNNDGHVLFSENDLELFKEFMILKNEKGMTVSKAIKQLVQPESMSVITVMPEQVMAVITEVRELKEIVKRQEEYIKESLEKRDQLLMASIRESQERKKEANHQAKMEKRAAKSELKAEKRESTAQRNDALAPDAVVK